MTDIVLKDADPVLVDRIRRIADAHGWTVPRTLLYLLEQGLHVVEGDGSVRLDGVEVDALAAAIAALEQVPDDKGYAMIGRIPHNDGD
jgi:nucleoside-diphosphate-sugar epimerase